MGGDYLFGILITAILIYVVSLLGYLWFDSFNRETILPGKPITLAVAFLLCLELATVMYDIHGMPFPFNIRISVLGVVAFTLIIALSRIK